MRSVGQLESPLGVEVGRKPTSETIQLARRARFELARCSDRLGAARAQLESDEFFGSGEESLLREGWIHAVDVVQHQVTETRNVERSGVAVDGRCALTKF